MNNSLSIRRQVEFHETDMAGIVHFSNYFRWMEAAETALLKTLGVSIAQKDEAIITGWPKVNANCNFTAPLAFQDEIEIKISIREIKASSLSYEFQFLKIENDQRNIVATASMTTVYAKFDILQGTMTAALISDPFRSKLETFLKPL